MKQTWPAWSLTKCQPPPPQPSKVCICVFKGEGSSNKRDFFVITRKGIVVVIDGSERAVAGFRIHIRFTCQRCRTYILQLPDRFTPRGIQTLPNSSMKCRPCGLMELVQWWAYEVEEPG